jgi:DNA-binding NtrC family response regulator
MQRLTVFHLDDDLFALQRVRDQLPRSQELCEFAVESFETEDALMAALKGKTKPDLILLDIHLGPGLENRGVAVAAALRARHWNGPVIAYSSDFGTIRQSLLAGASDFVLKTEDMKALAIRLFAAHRQVSGSTIAATSEKMSQKIRVIGDTMRQVAGRLSQIQGSAIRSIHISGESGTGKEVVADLWHACQPDRAPFLKVNCAAISPHLLESELFGHVRGAFTGAVGDKTGFLEAASGGSLFLDEVACLSSSAQAALLRALENREIIRVGDTKARPVDLKIVSASNIPLERQVAQGLFRNDLLQRLREAEIVLPPLRQRRAEIGEFLDHFCTIESGGPYHLADEARTLLLKADWADGNIRAVRNAVRGMTEHHVERMLSPKAIPAWVWRQIDENAGQTVPTEGSRSDRKTLVITLPEGSTPQLETLIDLVFVEAVRHLRDTEGRHSLRSLGEALGLPKTTLASRLARVRERGLMAEQEWESLNGPAKGKSR